MPRPTPAGQNVGSLYIFYAVLRPTLREQIQYACYSFASIYTTATQ